VTLTVYDALMTLSADFTDEIADAMNFIELAHHAVLVVAEQAAKLCRKRLQLLFA
jgi:hypothetical protein